MNNNIEYQNTAVVMSSDQQAKRAAKLFWVLIFLSAISVTSCKKLVGVDPPINSITEANIYASDATAISVVTGIYATMSTNQLSDNGLTSISLLAGLSADEFKLYSGSTNQKLIKYHTNSLSGNNVNGVAAGTEFWFSTYRTIFATNAAIEGISKSTSLTPGVKKQLLGELKFLRAFFYFYLVNLYGDVPLLTTTDYKVNATLARTPKATVYQQIIKDLKDADGLLSSDYLDKTLLVSTTERVRPTKWASSALLARAYLFTGDWAHAEAQATSVINNSGLFNLTTLNNAFLKNNSEAVWQLQPVSASFNTQDARTFIIPTTGPDDLNPIYLSTSLLNSFEAGDNRRAKWVDSVIANGITYYYPFKYKISQQNVPVSEYSMVLRLAEQYLIRSEAKARQNNSAGATADLNVIRARAGLPNTTAGDQTSLLVAILKERRVELFSEWGHRWFDLKRSGNIDAVMNIVTPLKGGVWASYKQWYPIPLSDILKDPNLTQNTGY